MGKPRELIDHELPAVESFTSSVGESLLQVVRESSQVEAQESALVWFAQLLDHPETVCCTVK
jgi:hypothetical protein